MTQKARDYELTSEGSFRIRNYHEKKPFSNFLPGIAGLYGTPMWVFYVNRGQGVASFGTKNKDRAILEFFPANKAYQMVTQTGFRTFIKSKNSSHRVVSFYEPFRANVPLERVSDLFMEIHSHEFSIREINPSAGLETQVTYFTVPGEPIAALARELVLTNISRHAADLEILDGLPQVNPYGMNEFFIKQMSRTIEAWMIADNVEKKAPYLRLKVDATDRPEVALIEEGNFYFSFADRARARKELLEPLVDPAVIFGPVLDFNLPKIFYEETPYNGWKKQITENRTPCAFSFATARLAPGKSVKIQSFFGQARSIEVLNRYVGRAGRAGYLEEKRQENRRLIENIKSTVFTVTSRPEYDLYCGQTYLDNVMRGGMPVVFGKDFVFYVYSRKHGDLERDYNRFLIEASYFAQGDGNYRDVNQNRRNDVWFKPEVKDVNIKTFLSFLQLDGFNPLVVKGTDFHFKKTGESRKILRGAFGGKNLSAVEEFLSRPFQLGEFYRFLETNGLVTPARFEKWFGALSAWMIPEQKAEHGEGFWVDHWTYNLDLIESYLAIYPENLRKMLFETREYTFFDNDHRVRSRAEKYVVQKGNRVRQLGAVFQDKEKSRIFSQRLRDVNVARTRHGRGSIYKTTLFVKLLVLFVNKFASLDAEGIGIEMEADKPSWYDALNGLPGLLGSSLPETFELKQLALFLVQALEENGVTAEMDAALPVELLDFLKKLSAALSKHFEEKEPYKNFAFWNVATGFKEKFREETFFGLSGRERRISISEIKVFLEHAREKIELGLERGFDAKKGLFPTYFSNELVRYQKHGEGVKPLRFRQEALPLFLEAPVHALKVEKDPKMRRALSRAVRESALYDRKLSMYKVNAPLKEASLEVGRARVFTPGWLENESVWLHMEYKWMLEELKAGLFEEFFQDFQKALVPFQSPERYGRSILENSSFIVSSVFPDSLFHGTGFVARLSGSTAEFLNMWLLMNIGKRPFSLGPDKKVTLRFEPHLPEFLFVKEDTVRNFWSADRKEARVKVPKNGLAFMFLGKTLVVYHNPKRLDTFGKMRVSVKKITLRDSRDRTMEFKGDTVPSPWSLKVRDEFIPRIYIELG